MKVLFGWIFDPCIDLLFIALLLVWLGSGVERDPAATDQAIQPHRCFVCDCFHPGQPICPLMVPMEAHVFVADAD